jgi:carbon-monoxide dehydrogenase small subunit
MSQERTIRFTHNGTDVETTAPPHWTLLQVLRDRLLAWEVKYGCGEGECGACAVLLDGEPVNACLVLGVHADGRSVATSRGLGEDHPLVRAFIAEGAVQCGFCTPGMLVTAEHLLGTTPSPSREQVRAALSANLCRCTGYGKIVDAVEAAARGSGVGSQESGATSEGREGSWP